MASTNFNPLVSIIMPVYNRDNFLVSTINSITNQTYINWELIVVDDGSTDLSLRILKDFAEEDSRIRVFSRPASRLKGANNCRNFGFEKAQGHFINFFDSDDKMHPEFIRKKLIRFENEESIDLVLSKTIKVFTDGHHELEMRTKLTSNLLEDYITRKVSWYLPDGMIRRKALIVLDPFKEDLQAGQDRDFYIRLLYNCRKVEVIDAHLTYYHYHEASISQSLYRSGNLQMSLSHYYGLQDQVTFLKNKKLLSKNLKQHYFHDIKKKLPAVFKCKASKMEFLKMLWSLSGRNTIASWGEIFVAFTSFSILGKGEKFLK